MNIWEKCERCIHNKGRCCCEIHTAIWIANCQEFKDKDNESITRCAICGKNFSSNKGMKIHKGLVHND